MKTTSILSVTAALLLVTCAASTVRADLWDSRHHYRRDNYGYWDNGNHYRHYDTWNHHHGYWDTRGATRVFINVD